MTPERRSDKAVRHRKLFKKYLITTFFFIQVRRNLALRMKVGGTLHSSGGGNSYATTLVFWN